MRSSRQVSLVVGDSARLRCDALGSPAPEVVWYKDDAILEGTARQRATWSLQLGHVTEEDAATYTCVVYNHVGTISFAYNVTVTSIFATILQFCFRFNFFFISELYIVCLNCQVATVMAARCRIAAALYE